MDTLTDARQRPDARLLVVEDEPNILELLSASLRYAGFDVVTAAAGTEAVQAAQRHRPDLIVLDVMLPDMDGSVVATVAIFLPAFFLVAISGPFVPRLRQSRLTGAALDGVNVAALALMIVVTYQLARTAFVDWPTAALGMLSVWLLLRYRLNSAWLVVGGAITGALASTLHLG